MSDDRVVLVSEGNVVNYWEKIWVSVCVLQVENGILLKQGRDVG